ncbi:hypothetical protein CROQUDRAFT_94827 [Cronartium quercuum f. sp. fusiforme G11]|uniref:Uncharacterized protein n=1 Tax=Cronartium quercuum f. sp. fusiforme G11 TaxID=708437 RepID=A0A9P6NI26_9BASI|nr:hypothetical protein CROQUDRAFT_94827 [Cronartium quercuum f. sp. fusiforme G11]
MVSARIDHIDNILLVLRVEVWVQLGVTGLRQVTHLATSIPLHVDSYIDLAPPGLELPSSSFFDGSSPSSRVRERDEQVADELLSRRLEALGWPRTRIISEEPVPEGMDLEKIIHVTAIARRNSFLTFGKPNRRSTVVSHSCGFILPPLSASNSRVLLRLRSCDILQSYVSSYGISISPLSLFRIA